MNMNMQTLKTTIYRFARRFLSKRFIHVPVWVAIFQLAQCDASENHENIVDKPDAESHENIVDKPDAESAAWKCQAAEGTSPDYLNQIGCRSDYDGLAAEPLDTTIAGVVSVKTLVDQLDSDKVYFQNSDKYQTHWEFAQEHVPAATRLEHSSFNQIEYYSSERHFLLGAIKYYRGPGTWVYEIAPYDNSSAEIIEKAYQIVAQNCYPGNTLAFRPTSEAIETQAAKLPSSVPVISTEQLVAATDYRPLNLGTTMGRLRFLTADTLATETIEPNDIIALDQAPSDIPWVAALVTEQPQTFISPANRLSQNRGTPNMSLKGARSGEKLGSFEGQWVRLEVGAFDYTIEAVSQREAETWQQQHPPPPVQLPAADESVTELKDAENILDPSLPLDQALDTTQAAFGATASHYGALCQEALTKIDEVSVRKAFAIPMHYYFQFMRDNGFDVRVDALLADESFVSDLAVRDARLQELRNEMKSAAVDPDFDERLLKKLAADYPDVSLAFRSSTNAEAIQGFPGTYMTLSKTGNPADSGQSIRDAVRAIWASVWELRAFEEKSARGIDHKSVGMALLVHQVFQNAAAHGVAITVNPYNTSGLEPAFYANVQTGDAPLTATVQGVTTDRFIHYYYYNNQPRAFISHSSEVSDGQTVLSRLQTFKLGRALDAIHVYFAKAYGLISLQPRTWYAMEVEFTLDTEGGGEPILWITNALPSAGQTQ